MSERHPLAHRLVVIDRAPRRFNYFGFQRPTEGRLAGVLTHLATHLVDALELREEIQRKGGEAHLEFPDKLYAQCTWRCINHQFVILDNDMYHTQECLIKRGVGYEP